PQRLAVSHRHENGEGRVRRVEQLLFELVELRGGAKGVGFDLLHPLAQAFHLRTSVLVRRTRPCAHAQQSAHHDQKMLAHWLSPYRSRVGFHLMKLRWRGLAGSARAHRIRIVCKHDLFSLQPLPSRTNNMRRYSPVEGLDFGGPAVIEPKAP